MKNYNSNLWQRNSKKKQVSVGWYFIYFTLYFYWSALSLPSKSKLFDTIRYLTEINTKNTNEWKEAEISSNNILC